MAPDDLTDEALDALDATASTVIESGVAMSPEFVAKLRDAIRQLRRHNAALIGRHADALESYREEARKGDEARAQRSSVAEALAAIGYGSRWAERETSFIWELDEAVRHLGDQFSAAINERNEARAKLAQVEARSEEWASRLNDAEQGIEVWSERAATVEADAKRLREWKCAHGGCECEPPEGWTVTHESGGLFPQTAGWYAEHETECDRGPFHSRHDAAMAAQEEKDG